MDFEENLFYCLTLDDYSTPAFCSFGKDYFGDIAQMASLINYLESDKRHADNQTQLIQAFKEYLSGNTEIAHDVAYRNVQLLEPVYVYAQADSISDFTKLEHLNIWDCIYYMRWKKAKSSHFWLRHQKRYIRCVKTIFYSLQYAVIDADEEYKPIKYSMSFPGMIDFRDDAVVSNRLHVIEKVFENEKELLQDIENFRNTPDPIYTEIFNDIFGDG